MEFLVIGIVTAVNMIVIIMKFKRKRYEDGIFDMLLLTLVTVMFSGSYGGMVVSMVASMIISIYLFANPPKLFKAIAQTEEAKELVKEFKKLTDSAIITAGSNNKKPNKIDTKVFDTW